MQRSKKFSFYNFSSQGRSQDFVQGEGKNAKLKYILILC